MTLWGILVIDVAAVVLAAWILDLIRRGRLYVGYGVIFLVGLATLAVMSTFPGVLSASTWLVGTIFPTAPLSVIAFGLLGLLQVYILSQLTILSNRLATLVQEIAIRGPRGPASD